MGTTERARRGPQLLASTGAFMLSPLGWAMEAIAQAGFTGAEVVLNHQRDSRDPTMVAGFARQAGLEVPVVHGPYMIVLRTVFGSDYRIKTQRSLERTAAFGAHTMVAHAPFRWERKARHWLREGAAEAIADEFGVRFAMENLYPVAGRSLSSVVTPGQLAPYRHVVFDTSHFAVTGIDLMEAWEALCERVVHLHVSDNHGTGGDHHAPIGEGTLPLAAFLAHVGRSGYEGTLTLEVDGRPYLATRESMVAFLTRERVKAERLLAGSDLDEAAEAADDSAPPPADAPRVS